LTFALIDLNDPETSAISAYMHGCFVPMLRLDLRTASFGWRFAGAKKRCSELLESGYPKDIVNAGPGGACWRNRKAIAPL